MASHRPTDNEIREILRKAPAYTSNPDYWAWLEECATDPKLKEECSDQWARAYHVEEYNAGIL